MIATTLMSAGLVMGFVIGLAFWFMPEWTRVAIDISMVMFLLATLSGAIGLLDQAARRKSPGPSWEDAMSKPTWGHNDLMPIHRWRSRSGALWGPRIRSPRCARCGCTPDCRVHLRADALYQRLTSTTPDNQIGSRSA